jgi:Na+/proline symporter
MNGVLIGMVVYVLAQFAVGAWVSRRMTTEADYILAGRRLGTGLVVFSVFATYFGAEAIVASGGSVYEKGLAGGLVDPFGYAAAIVIVGLFFARSLWSRGLTTFADLFRKRYSQGVERLVVIILLPGSVIWAAAQVRAFGQVLSANSALGLATAITLAAVLVAAYSVVGGLLADAVTDTIQGIAVVAGLVILAAVVVSGMGGLGQAVAQIEPARLTPIDHEESLLATLEHLAIPVCGTIVAVELISRFLGARSAQIAASGTVMGGAIYLAVGAIPVLLGLLGPTLQLDVADNEQFIAKLAEKHLVGPIYIVFVGAIVSAILSAVHAALHAPASQLSHNILVRAAPGLSETGKLWSVRLTVLALSVLAFLIAITSEGIHELVETASAFGSAGVFVATIFALFTRFGGPASAYAAIISGMLVWAIGKYALELSVPYLLGLLAAFVGYVALAWVDTPASMNARQAEPR